MYYINTKEYGEVETFDEFETLKETRLMLKAYRMSTPSVYISNRSTKAWRDR